MPLPSVAVVILNWNGRNFLQKFLPSVTASSYTNFRVVVADNASTDDSIVFLERNYPAIQLLRNEQNEGFAKGYNTALKHVQADYYVLLNSDVEVDAGWIDPVISLMESDIAVAAAQPKIRSYLQKERFEYAGAAGGWLDRYGYPFSRGRVFDFCEVDNGQYNSNEQVFWASGAAFFVRAAVFHELGGFDERFFAHQEEIDLCWRMQRAGYKVFAVPSSIVYHVGGGTLPMGNSRKVYLNFRNNLLMLSKNLPAAEKLVKIPIRLLLDNLSAWQAIARRDSNTFRAVYKAHAHFLKIKRQQPNGRGLPKIKTKALAGVYNGSVVWKYFIQKKKTFSEIVGGKK